MEGHARISIPASLSYINAVSAFCTELAQNMGFNEEDIYAVHLAIEESLSNVIKFGYENDPSEKIHIILEPNSKGLLIRILEKGIPFNPRRLPDYQPEHPERDTSGAGLSLYLLNKFTDEVSFIRRGRLGQEIRLVKYRGDHIEQTLAAKQIPACTVASRSTRPTDYIIRKMKREEAVEVSICAYKCYGYTYEDYVYYPNLLAAYNADGLLYSLVALTTEGELMGHAGLKRSNKDAVIAESGVAFVYPEYRKLGLFGKFNDEFITYAKVVGLKGLYGRAVTSHVASQRMAKQHGYHDSGLFLGIAPDDVSFKEIAGKTVQRESFVLSYLNLNPGETRNVYLPGKYERLADRLFQELNVSVRFCSGEDKASGDFDIEISRNQNFNLAEMLIHQYGSCVLDDIKNQIRSLREERIDIIHAILNMEDPFTSTAVTAFESLGFYFAGILPYGVDNQHCLIMQFLNNVRIDFEKIKLISIEASMILDFIQNQERTIN